MYVCMYFFKNSFWKWKFLFWKLKHYFRYQNYVENQNFFQCLECPLKKLRLGNHFEKVPVGDGNLDFRSQNSHFENFSWKLKFDLKVQKSYNILEITVLFWVIKNFILIVKKCFQSFPNVGVGVGTPNIKWRGWQNGGKNQNPKNP